MPASSRDLIPSSPAIKRRKRAKTEVLLGEDFKEIVTEILERPSPPNHDTEYNEKRLRAGLKYADWTLRNSTRKLSPVGMRALMLYKEACARSLEFEIGEIYENEDGEDITQEIKDEFLSTVRTYERSLQYNACLRITSTEGAQTLQDELIRLRRLSFYARYGDILAVACRELKSEAEAKKVDGWKIFSNAYWTDISKIITEEEPIWKKVLDGAPRHIECKTLITVSLACHCIGFNYEDMIAIIHHYAKRNELLHSEMVPALREGRFDNFKKRLHDDFCAIPLVIDPSEGIQGQLVITMINIMIDKWFTRDVEDPANYQLWVPTPNLFELRKKLRGPNPPHQADLNREIAADIIKGSKQREREAAKEKELEGLLESNLTLMTTPIVAKVKRVASSQLVAEFVGNKKRKLDWEKLMNLVGGMKEMSEVYLSEYGDLGGPPLVLRNRSLDYSYDYNI